jgi:hypothetical protein
MNITVVWGITSYIHGDVLTIRVLFLINCLAYGIYFLPQLSEKGYRFLLGLFFKNWGLKRI